MSCSWSVPGQAATHHALPTDTDAVGILVGAASPIVHWLLHVSHIPRFSGLTVQVTSLGSCGAKEKKGLHGGQWSKCVPNNYPTDGARSAKGQAALGMRMGAVQWGALGRNTWIVGNFGGKNGQFEGKWGRLRRKLGI